MPPSPWGSDRHEPKLLGGTLKNVQPEDPGELPEGGGLQADSQQIGEKCDKLESLSIIVLLRSIFRLFSLISPKTH